MIVVMGFKKLRPHCELPVKPGTFCTLCDVSGFLLKHAYSETHTHTHTRSDAVLHSEFSVCHGKLG